MNDVDILGCLAHFTNLSLIPRGNTWYHKIYEVTLPTQHGLSRLNTDVHDYYRQLQTLIAVTDLVIADKTRSHK